MSSFQPPNFKSAFLTADREALLTRYLRLRLIASPTGDNAVSGVPNLDASITLPNQIVIRTNEAESHPFHVGHCIYCDATELFPNKGDPLTEEHIVARGWGGTLILEAASCGECQKHINDKIENIVLTHSFLASRRRLGLRGRKRGRVQKKDSYEVEAHVNGRSIKLTFPLNCHPTVLFFVGFDTPRALGGNGGPATMFAHTFESYENAMKAGLDNVFSPSIDTVRFSQMLAKIAHAYAVWRVGEHHFRPYLRSFILRKFRRDEAYPECYNLIGGHPRLAAAAPPDILHQLGHTVVERDGKRLLVVGIRLLANLSAPLYWVVAGEML